MNKHKKSAKNLTEDILERDGTYKCLRNGKINMHIKMNSKANLCYSSRINCQY